MPHNQKESLIFTVIMCSFMVFLMTVYNVSLHIGFSMEAIQKAWLGFPLGFIVGVICDLFIVSKTAKKIAFKFIKSDTSQIKKGILISSCMVCGMVFLMSLYGAIDAVGFSSLLFITWLKNIPTNFIVALPLQLLIVGPAVRFIFRKAFPIGYILSEPIANATH